MSLTVSLLHSQSTVRKLECNVLWRIHLALWTVLSTASIWFYIWPEWTFNLFCLTLSRSSYHQFFMIIKHLFAQNGFKTIHIDCNYFLIQFQLFTFLNVGRFDQIFFSFFLHRFLFQIDSNILMDSSRSICRFSWFFRIELISRGEWRTIKNLTFSSAEALPFL